jgi:hypothetical protein
LSSRVIRTARFPSILSIVAFKINNSGNNHLHMSQIFYNNHSPSIYWGDNFHFHYHSHSTNL